MNTRVKTVTFVLLALIAAVFAAMAAQAYEGIRTPSHSIVGGDWTCQQLPVVAAFGVNPQDERPFDPHAEPDGPLNMSVENERNVFAHELCGVAVPVHECDPFHDDTCADRCEWNEQWHRWVNCGAGVQGTPVPIETPVPTPDPYAPFCSPMFDDDNPEELDEDYACCAWEELEDDKEGWVCYETKEEDLPEGYEIREMAINRMLSNFTFK